MIVRNAHAINAGELPALDAKDQDFFFLARENEADIAKTVVDLCLNRLPRRYGEQVREQIQVLCPSRKGEAGTVALNLMLQRYLNPPSPQKRERRHNGVTFREGDKVMQIHNNYDLTWEKEGVEGVGVFNGDIGRIEQIDLQGEQLTVNFDDRIVHYDFTLLDELEHSFAITVHKSQGSEYPVVILPVYSYTPKLLTRNLLYTAVTRAQSMVLLVGRADVVQGMVENHRQQKRYTGLQTLLRQTDL
jgi:exodeoxyribonuclease V alpha subunit